MQCPGCSAAMSPTDAFLHCDGCSIAWLTNTDFDRLLAETERRFRPDALAALEAECRQRHKDLAAQAFEEGAAVKYYDCPDCGSQMSRRAFAQTSGIIVNRCVEHGLLLGDADLLQVLDFIRRGGEILTINRQVEDLEEELAEAIGREKDAEQRARRTGAGGMPIFIPLV
ncbi:MAG: hypothetical protein VYE77_02985 [Planctomycetota bacterium]|nr:hypothetical protein [Planctomycetota bacterium]